MIHQILQNFFKKTPGTCADPTTLIPGLLFLLTVPSCSTPGAGKDKPSPKSVVTRSPDGEVKIQLSTEGNGPPRYSISFRDSTLIESSRLGLKFRDGGVLGPTLSVHDVTRRTKDHTYSLVAGKSEAARNYFHEATVTLREQRPPHRKLKIVLRAYNDGAAFRYRIPEQEGMNSFKLVNERTRFRFAGDPRAWITRYKNYETGQEKQFLPNSLASISPDDIVGLPLTLRRDSGIVMSLMEANLTDYAGMYLGRPEQMEHTLQTQLAPRPEDEEVKVVGSAPHSSPWRVLMVGDGPGVLIESNLILNLNEPSDVKDTSWIRPGKVVFPWWSNFQADAPGVKDKLTFQNQKYYIDFASEFGIKYLELEPPWYGPIGKIIENPLKFDITTPDPDLNLPELRTYAKKKGVDLLIWAHWKNVDHQMDNVFETFQNWGMKGVKIDFMNRDDQVMVNWYHTVLKKAAKHQLLVFLHGAYKPTGIRRTYPHLLTREAVRGLEYAKMEGGVGPKHTVTLPFTRMTVGPMDFTPGSFQNVTREQFTSQWSSPMVPGTRCHQLALFVVLESPLQMISGAPGNIRGSVGADWIRTVPASWDETRYLTGKIGEYIAIARRKGNDWYVGAIGDWTARDLTLSLDFLENGPYRATIYADGPDADENPTSARTSTKTLTSGDTVDVHLAPGGGYAMHLEKE